MLDDFSCWQFKPSICCLITNCSPAAIEVSAVVQSIFKAFENPSKSVTADCDIVNLPAEASFSIMANLSNVK